jgi:L-2,4-diaminobutyrate decarboxylase
MFENEFLTEKTRLAYRDAIVKASEALLDGMPAHPYTGKTPAEVAALIKAEVLPADGSSLDKILAKVQPIIANSVNVTQPHTLAHLHPPPLIASLGAEIIISALNQSMDSFDQAPAATVFEQIMARWLCEEVGLPPGADAIFTTGGTQSNFMGLLLARDTCIASRWKWPVQKSGVPPQASSLRILGSEVAHFTIEKSACQLGLGTDSVVKVPVDGAFRMVPAALEQSLEQVEKSGLVPAAIVATAGTTDFGSIDPLAEIAALARQSRAWLHVDAAYGSALLLSTRHRHKLRGIENADSISVDFHKLFWQPIPCAAFLLRDARQFRQIEVHADYLNPEAHDDAGIPNLVNKSLGTTRRFDALKLWFSLQMLGREKFGQMVDRTIELAAYAGDWIRNNPSLELTHEPELGCVVFRYLPRKGSDADTVNSRLRNNLFNRGVAVIGHTRVRRQQCLKFTCMNPMTSEEDLGSLLKLILEEGQRLESAA